MTTQTLWVKTSAKAKWRKAIVLSMLGKFSPRDMKKLLEQGYHWLIMKGKLKDTAEWQVLSGSKDFHNIPRVKAKTVVKKTKKAARRSR